jgi:hypothetical protein
MGDLLGMRERGRHDLRSVLRNHSPEFLEWLNPLLAGDKEFGAGVSDLVSAGVGAPLVRDSVLFHGLLGDAVSGIPFREVSSWVRGLSRYEAFDHVVEFGREDDDVIQQCVGLLKVTTALGDESLTGLHVVRGMISNEALKNLVMERPSDAGEIARMIRENHVTDAATIRGLLNGVVPSLASGTL